MTTAGRPARAVADDSIHRTVETVWRMESPKIIARLARLLRDVGLAEETAQDALVTALEQWPRNGIPDNPAAWLMVTARNRAFDQLRRGSLVERRNEVLTHEVELL